MASERAIPGYGGGMSSAKAALESDTRVLSFEAGRKYGLRLWMFAQSVGQLRNAYKNADGMLGSCAVRIFMNPTGADGLAERLSDEIGFVDALDGSRKKLVEASELAGPNYREQQIVLGLATRPAKVSKDYAWRNEGLKARMGSV